MKNPDVNEQSFVAEEESLLGRWSRRKHEKRGRDAEPPEADSTTNNEPTKAVVLTDADMPPIESLGEESDYSGFLSPKVSETLRKQALQKLFHSPAYNIRDGLDDYDGVYTEFEKLGSVVTADMHHQMAMETKRQMQQLAEQQSTEDIEQIEVASTSPEFNETAEKNQAHVESASEQVLVQSDDKASES